MANLKKNGNLSGAIGNIVFVNDGDRVFVRTKPYQVKQSPQTKAAAEIFGKVSSVEKIFRLQLLRNLELPAPQYFAARHRARIRKTVIQADAPDSGAKFEFGNPQAMTGFDFNPKREWSSCSAFFPVIETHTDGSVNMILPNLRWGKEIVPPKNMESALLTLTAFTVSLNDKNIQLQAQSILEMEITRTAAAAAQEWIIGFSNARSWVFIISCLRFKDSRNNVFSREEFSATYLWAELRNEITS